MPGNFSPIVMGADADAETFNTPLYQIDLAVQALQIAIGGGGGGGGGFGQQPFAVIGGTAQPTSADNVPVTADIAHSGKLVRGATSITSTGADMETRGNLAVGAGNHHMTGDNGMAVGDSNTVNSYSFVVGQGNSAGSTNSFVSGTANSTEAINSFVSGTLGAIDADSPSSSILGGQGNVVSGSERSVAGGGLTNTIDFSDNSMIGAGVTNQIIEGSDRGFIGAGTSNTLNSDSNNAFIGAGQNNVIDGDNAAVVAGNLNFALNAGIFIGAGYNNSSTGSNSAIAGGEANRIVNMVIDPVRSFIGAGYNNKIQDGTHSFIGAGRDNVLTGLNTYCGIVAGVGNVIDTAIYSFVGAGSGNWIGANGSFIGAGSSNIIDGSGSSAIIAGANNNNQGGWATVLNGSYHVIAAAGQFSVAGGISTNINHGYVFMWNSSIASTWNSAAAYEFAVNAHGGIRMRTNATQSTGMDMAAGASSWTGVSARALKGEFGEVEAESILDRLLSMPIQTYKFKRDQFDASAGYYDQINFGPVAEDWNAAFADILGEKTVINVVNYQEVATPAINHDDKLGVALAAIQGLAARFAKLEARLAN